MKITRMRCTETDKGKVRLVKCDSTTDPFAVYVAFADEPNVVKLLRKQNFHEATATYAVNAGIVKPLESEHATTEAAQ